MAYPTAVAVYDAEARRWASLAPNVDIASQGDTAEEAIEMVLDAVREVAQLCQEEGRPMPTPVSWEDFGDFVRGGDRSMVVIRMDTTSVTPPPLGLYEPGAQSGGGGGG